MTHNPTASWNAYPGRASEKTLNLLALFYLAAIILPLTVRVGTLYLTSLRVFAMMLVIPLFFNLLRGKYGRIIAIDGLLFAHFLWSVLALTVNNPDKVIEQAGSVGIELIGGYLAGRAAIRSREDYVALARTFMTIIICLLPLTLFEMATGQSLILKALQSIPGASAPRDLSIGKRLGLDRVQSGFVHPIHFGLFCSVALSLCYVGMKGVLTEGKRFTAGAILTFSGFSALSSGALLAILLQLGLIAWARIFASVKRRWWLLVGLFVVLYIAIDLLSNRTPIRVFLHYATFSAHTAYWRTLIFDYGMDNVWKNPWLGLGLNDWERPYWMYSGSMDNFWLVMAVRYGIPGFALIALAWLLGLFRVMRRDFSADPALNQLRVSWVFTIVGLTFTLCTVHVWSSIYSFVFFIFAAGLWLIDAEPEGKRGAGAPREEPTPASDGNTRSRFTRFPAGGGTRVVTGRAIRPSTRYRDR